MMKPVVLEPFHQCYNIRFGGNFRSREAVLFLHGFPAEQGNKNIDLAQQISEECELDVYLMHYRGLGESTGEFTFMSALEDACAYAQKLISDNGYSHLHLVGHSWGGLVATEVYHRIPLHRGRLILLAPFSDIAEGDGPMQLALYFMRHYPHVIHADRFSAVSAELQTIRDKFNPAKTAAKLTSHAGNVMIIHATKDDIIPKAMTEKFGKAWGREVHYVDLDSDHRFFHNRDQMIATVMKFMHGRTT